MLIAFLCVERVKAEKKLAPTSRFQDIPTAEQTLASHLPPTVEPVGAGPAPEPQHEMEAINPDPNVRHSFQFVVFILTLWLPFVDEARGCAP